jgi:hypothetical protein
MVRRHIIHVTLMLGALAAFTWAPLPRLDFSQTPQARAAGLRQLPVDVWSGASRRWRPPPPPPIQTYTVDQLKARPVYQRTIRLRGVVLIRARRCTRRACSRRRPCCNRCVSSYLIQGRRAQLPLQGGVKGRFGCWGTECSMQCTPLKRGVRYELTGQLHRDGTFRVRNHKMISAPVPGARVPPHTYSVDQLVTPPLWGGLVQIHGTVTQGPKRCTTRRCTRRNRCCNRCGASYVIKGRLVTVALALAKPTQLFGCQGNSCRLTCSPLTPGRRYQLLGRLDKTLVFRVERYSLLNP